MVSIHYPVEYLVDHGLTCDLHNTVNTMTSQSLRKRFPDSCRRPRVEFFDQESAESSASCAWYWETAAQYESEDVLREVLYHSARPNNCWGTSLRHWTTAQLVVWLQGMKFLGPHTAQVVESVVEHCIDGEGFEEIVLSKQKNAVSQLRLQFADLERICVIMNEWRQAPSLSHAHSIQRQAAPVIRTSAATTSVSLGGDVVDDPIGKN